MQEDLPENAHVEPVQVPDQKPGVQGGKRDLNRRAKTQQIAKAALELFLEAGVEKVTIDDIVNAANVAKGSFYRYFKDKEALVEALVQPLGQRALGALKRCSEAVEVAESVEAQKDAYLELAEKMAGVLFSDPDVLRLYLQEKRGPLRGPARPIRQLTRDIGALALETTEKAHAKGLLKPISAQVSTLVVVGAVEELLFQILSGEGVGNLLELPAAVADLIFYGLHKPE